MGLLLRDSCSEITVASKLRVEDLRPGIVCESRGAFDGEPRYAIHLIQDSNNSEDDRTWLPTQVLVHAGEVTSAE